MRAHHSVEGSILTILKASKKTVFDRLTDHKAYTGTHQKRFDSAGKGKGAAGRDRVAKGGGTVKGADPGDKVGDLSQITRSNFNAGAKKPAAKGKKPMSAEKKLAKMGVTLDDESDADWICFACKKRAPDRSTLIDFNNHFYHSECLVCEKCKSGFPDGNIYPKDEKLYCKRCYHKLFIPSCTKCKKPLDSGEVVSIPIKSEDEKEEKKFNKYHRACFKCHLCNKQLQKFHMQKDGSVLCDACVQNRKVGAQAGKFVIRDSPDEEDDAPKKKK